MYKRQLSKTVTVRDTLPAGITFDNDTLIQVGTTGTVYTEQKMCIRDRYDANSRTITWTETINNINTYTNPESGSIEINKTIKLVYTGIDHDTTNIENIVRGKISTKTPVKESDEVVSEFNTTTEFLVNIPVSKIWEDEDNKLNQRPNRVCLLYTSRCV